MGEVLDHYKSSKATCVWPDLIDNGHYAQDR